MASPDRLRNALLFAQIAILIAGGLWVLGGLLLYTFVSPIEIDGTYWNMIDPISDERAAALQRESFIYIFIGTIAGAGHVAAAAVCRKAWGRWLLMIMGGLYSAVALPLAAGAVLEPGTALTVSAAVAMALGLVLLNASRAHRTAVEGAS